MASAEALERARQLIDRAHGADPAHDADGRAAELVYADRMERWVSRLVPDAPELLRLAARCQHLERWSVPRDSYAMDRAGYNEWRRTLYRVQADRARDLLLEAGIASREADEVAEWVAKRGLLRNPGTQALEDAACLVFFEHEIESFAAKHEDYPAEKMRNIVRRIWRKMTPDARRHAIELPMPQAVRQLVADTVESE